MIFRSNAQATFAGVLLVLAVIALAACATPAYLQGTCTVTDKLQGGC